MVSLCASVQSKTTLLLETACNPHAAASTLPDKNQPVPLHSASNSILAQILVSQDQYPHPCKSRSQALGIPKVALLFLTRGDLYLSPAWRLWFQSAAGVVPRTAARCSGVASEAVRAGCPGPGPTAALDLPDERMIDAQHLFTAYVHAPPSVNGGWPSGGRGSCGGRTLAGG